MKKPKYSILKQAGSGSYGSVLKAIDNDNQQFVAIKKFKIQNDEGCDASQLREICVLVRCKHPNILKLINIHYDDKDQGNRYYLVFEYCQYDLYTYQRLKEFQDKCYFQNLLYQVLNGLNYLHNQGILHRDIKPSNILVHIQNNEVKFKLADFGISRVLFFQGQQSPITPDTITLNYRAPEILLGSTTYTFSVDIWSVGCLFYEICMGKPLFNCNTQIGTLFEQFRLLGTPSQIISPTLIDLPFFKISKFPQFIGIIDQVSEQLYEVIGQDGVDLFNQLLQLEPSKRINSQLAINHCFFDFVKQNKLMQIE